MKIMKISFDFKQLGVTIGGLIVIGLVVSTLVVVSGIVPIKASSGHWPITKWFLQFSKNRSVATHSQAIEPPPLDDPARVLRGAGHFETACARCHGSPLRDRSPVALASTPTPPKLPPLIQKREPRELFYVVKHGILFTGMPAWPAQSRDDEVWDMVAFLIQLPAMDDQAYRDLVFLESNSDAESVIPHKGMGPVETCQRCHGDEGTGRGQGAFPHLAGQNEQYIRSALDAYATGERNSGVMQTVAAVLTSQERQAFAAHFAELEPASSTGDDSADDTSAEEEASIARGREIVEKGIPAENVPSCKDCHGPDGSIVSNRYPLLAGQPASYIQRQLELFHDQRRGGGPAANLMEPVASGLPQESFRDVARYYESLTPQ